MKTYNNLRLYDPLVEGRQSFCNMMIGLFITGKYCDLRLEKTLIIKSANLDNH